MKISPFYLVILLLIVPYSCKKSNSGNSTPQPAYYLSAAVAITPGGRIVDSFYYDTLHRLDTFTQYIYDTIGSTSGFNTWTIQFIYQDTNSWPSWYNFYDQPLGGYGDYHLLSYDADLRMTKDTSLSGSGLVTYFTYPNGNIAITTLPEGTPDNNFIDTAYVSNGNVSTETNWFPQVPGGADVNSGEAWFTYASAANPAYHTAISRSLGPLLFNWTFSNNGEFLDFISKNAYQKETNTGEFAPLAVSSLIYTMTTDSKGRLAKLTSVADGGSQAATVVFNYY